MGLTENIRKFFNNQDTKAMYSMPTSNVIFPYNTDIGFFSGTDQMNPEGNSAALACLNVLGTAFSEPKLVVMQRTPEGDEIVENHAASMLYEKPSPYMSANLLANYITSAIAVSGDAFILKLRNELGEVVQLFPLMPESVEVKGTKTDLITHYEYKQQGQTLDITREDMIHLRERIDPANYRRGYAPLRAVMVEILGDSAASQMAAALVKNMGVPGTIISPRSDLGMTSDEAENIADVFGRRFGGENRGRPLVISGGEIDVKTISFSPKDLEIGKLRYVNEERISASLGVPAILAGLGAGLERATYSNVKELREFFTEQKLIPMWRNIASELTNQLLLADFEDSPDFRFEYDLSNVRALSQDVDAEMDRIIKGVQAGFITLAEARKSTGFVADESTMDIYLRDMNQIEVAADGSGAKIYSGQDNQEVAPEKELKDDTFSYTADGERVHNSWIENRQDSDNKIIKEEEGKFCVYSEDGSRSFGCYSTRQEAEDRLNQIHSFVDDDKEKEFAENVTTPESYDLYSWEEPTTKFLGLPIVKRYNSEEEKVMYWKAIDTLREKWAGVFSNISAKELNRQKRDIVKAARLSQDIESLKLNMDLLIEKTDFHEELLPLYLSMADDFSLQTWDKMFPKKESFKAASEVDLDVDVTEQQALRTVFGTVAGLLDEGRTLKKIVEQGFYRGQRELPKAVGSVFQDGQAASYLQENARGVMKELNKTTRKRVATQISDALKEAEKMGIINPTADTPAGKKFFDDLANRINKTLGGQSLRRAKVIARTESLKATSWARERAAKATGKTLEKEWVSMRDDRVREAHIILDNQRVPMDSFYMYNGHKLDFPGDPKAPADLVINCRCTEAFLEIIDE